MLIGTGVGVYFLFDMEPSLVWTGAPLVPLLIAGYASGRVHHDMPLIFGALFWFNLGLFIVGARAYVLDTPMVLRESRVMSITGQVEKVQQSGNAALRLVISGVHLPERLVSSPARDLSVRITVRKFSRTPQAGDTVRLPAVLMPPPTASLPGGYDYARQLWFQGIGGVGYAVGEPEVTARPPGWVDRVGQYRQALAERIRLAYPGDRGGLAAALITGVRDGISEQTTENMRDAGLAHLLAISGLHMGLFTGAIFFFVRLLLAGFPSLALNLPIKKYAAGLAVLGGAVYLLLSGGSIPTIRAFIMVSIVFLGVMFDRKAISLRLVALAAILLLLATPEVLLSISFQMSFAAVTGLVYFYERYGASLTRWSNRENSMFRKVVGYQLAIVLTTIIAELTIGPIALFHFNRIVHFGLLANLVAMPVMALWVMPWIVIYLLLLPVQMENLALQPMMFGLDVIIACAGYVAKLPWSISLIPSMGTGALVTMVIGALWFILWQGKIRRAGLFIFLAGVGLALFYRTPDIMIDNRGRLIAVKGADGDLRLSDRRGSRIVREQWAQYYGQERADKWISSEDGQSGLLPIGCDSLSCLYHPVRGEHNWQIAFVQDERALDEDCRSADIVISLVPVKIKCSAPRLILDRWDFYEKGGHFIWLPDRPDQGIQVRNMRDLRGARPWTLPPR
ncbi:ComEC/Rec2 family competence protein [Emcibacter sp.]|uniref:ComEC/Rec2 family competence protein n=1 Tax=Emcibacter sp. TaxID=1979954 RepID=UPI003A90379F